MKDRLVEEAVRQIAETICGVSTHLQLTNQQFKAVLIETKKECDASLTAMGDMPDFPDNKDN